MVAKRSHSEYAGQFVSDAADDKGRGKLQSVVERNDLDDFLCNALLSDQSFEAERGQVIVMNLDQAVQAEENPDREEIYDYQDLPIPHRCGIGYLDSVVPLGCCTLSSTVIYMSVCLLFVCLSVVCLFVCCLSVCLCACVSVCSCLTLSRRPEWDEDTTPEELDRQERETFLTWRRELAATEAASRLSITPYEKNLEVWKQLCV